MTLTPAARGVTALVLACSVILGSWNRVGYSLARFLYQDDERVLALLVALVCLGVCAFAYAWAQSALRSIGSSRGAGERWGVHLAGAARVLAIFAAGMSVVDLLAGLVDRSPFVG